MKKESERPNVKGTKAGGKERHTGKIDACPR
jgi:hypothetical protein